MSDQSVETSSNEAQPSVSSESSESSGSAPESRWTDGLSSENRDHGSIKDFKSVDELAQSHIHAQKRLGTSVQVPGELATQDDLNKFYTKLGRPEQSDSYDFSGVKAPKDFTIPDDMINGFRTAAHTSGLNQKQASTLMDWYARTSEAQIATAQQQTATAKQVAAEKLREDWGSDYDSHTQSVSVALNRFFPDHLRDQVMEVALTNADFAKAIADIGSRMGEDTTSGARSASGGKDRRAEIESELKALRHDSKGAYLNGRDPNHNSEVDRVAAMLQELEDLSE
jgi:uncharacterized protein YcbK (DUF882 family)